MLEIISSKMFSILLKIVPSCLLRRLFPATKIKDDIEVDLRSKNPINITFGAMIPFFSVWLRITNKSSVLVEIDRIIIDVWIGQPLIQAIRLKRIKIRPKETNDEIMVQAFLSEIQKASILNLEQNGLKAVDVSLEIYISCDCKLGAFELTTRKEFNEVPIK